MRFWFFFHCCMSLIFSKVPSVSQVVFEPFERCQLSHLTYRNISGMHSRSLVYGETYFVSVDAR